MARTMQAARTSSFWLPAGIGGALGGAVSGSAAEAWDGLAAEEPTAPADDEPTADRRGSWTEEEDNILWELVDEIGRRWETVATQLGGKLDELGLDAAQHSMSGDACRRRYDLLRKKEGGGDEPPAGIPQPQGRPPNGKVWDRVNGEWIDDAATQDQAPVWVREDRQYNAETDGPYVLTQLQKDFEAHVDKITAERGGFKTMRMKQISNEILVPLGLSECTAYNWLKGTMKSQPKIEEAVQKYLDNQTKKTPVPNATGHRVSSAATGSGRSASAGGGGSDASGGGGGGGGDGQDPLVAKLAAEQAELGVKRKRYDEERATLEQRWKEDEAESKRKQKKIRDVITRKKEATAALQLIAEEEARLL